jgi:hypothetical protein
MVKTLTATSNLFWRLSNKWFPLISTTLDGFYQRYPTVPQQNITTLFGYLMEPMVSHLIEQTGSAPFSGGANTPAPKANPNRRPKRGPKGKPKGQWGNWHNAGQAANLAGGTFQAQTPPTFLGQDHEAEYMAEIERLLTRLTLHDTQHAFVMQQHAYAMQNGSSAVRPRSHYCGCHGWNNDHNSPECRAMANDPTCPAALRTATTHVGTGGNPKVGVPVGYVRPPPWTFPPPASVLARLACVASVPNDFLSPPISLAQCAKSTPLPSDDSCTGISPSPQWCQQSEGQKANLVPPTQTLRLLAPLWGWRDPGA